MANKIIIGNVYNESMIGDTHNFSDDFKTFSSVQVKRLAWFLEDGDIAILPSHIPQEILDNINAVKSTNLTQNNIIAISNTLPPDILTNKRLLDEQLIASVKERLDPNINYHFFAYHENSAIHTFEKLINNTHHSISNFMNQAGADALNSKATFRAIASGIINIAEGCICRTREELYWMLWKLLPEYKSIIIKQPLNAAGYGNICVTLEDRTLYSGVKEVFLLNHIHDLDANFATKIWESLTDNFGNNSLILEKYYHVQNTVYAEYDLHNEQHFLLSYGFVRMSKESGTTKTANWNGFEIPASLSPHLKHEFLNSCNTLAIMLRQLGFRGRINFDGVETIDEKIIFTEINARLGGCSHIDVVLKHIVGNEYLDTIHLLSRNFVPVSSIAKAISIAHDFTKNHKQGVVVLNADSYMGDVIEYLVYAQTPQEAQQLENEFVKHIA